MTIDWWYINAQWWGISFYKIANSSDDSLFDAALRHRRTHIHRKNIVVSLSKDSWKIAWKCWLVTGGTSMLSGGKHLSIRSLTRQMIFVHAAALRHRDILVVNLWRTLSVTQHHLQFCSNKSHPHIWSLLSLQEILQQVKTLNKILSLIEIIHSKSGKVCGVCFSVTKKSAEKVRKSLHKNFASKVRKSIKSLKMHHLKAKCIKIWHQEHVNQRFWAF